MIDEVGIWTAFEISSLLQSERGEACPGSPQGISEHQSPGQRFGWNLYLSPAVFFLILNSDSVVLGHYLLLLPFSWLGVRL